MGPNQRNGNQIYISFYKDLNSTHHNQKGNELCRCTIINMVTFSLSVTLVPLHTNIYVTLLITVNLMQTVTNTQQFKMLVLLLPFLIVSERQMNIQNCLIFLRNENNQIIMIQFFPQCLIFLRQYLLVVFANVSV